MTEQADRAGGDGVRWKLAPVEATHEMVRAAYQGQPDAIRVGFAEAYRTMLAATPPQPAPDALRERDKERPIIVHCIGVLVEKFGSDPIEAAWNIFDYFGKPKSLAALSSAPVPSGEWLKRNADRAHDKLYGIFVPSGEEKK